MTHKTIFVQNKTNKIRENFRMGGVSFPLLWQEIILTQNLQRTRPISLPVTYSSLAVDKEMHQTLTLADNDKQ